MEARVLVEDGQDVTMHDSKVENGMDGVSETLGWSAHAMVRMQSRLYILAVTMARILVAHAHAQNIILSRDRTVTQSLDFRVPGSWFRAEGLQRTCNLGIRRKCIKVLHSIFRSWRPDALLRLIIRRSRYRRDHVGAVTTLP